MSKIGQNAIVVYVVSHTFRLQHPRQRLFPESFKRGCPTSAKNGNARCTTRQSHHELDRLHIPCRVLGSPGFRSRSTNVSAGYCGGFRARQGVRLDRQTQRSGQQRHLQAFPSAGNASQCRRTLRGVGAFQRNGYRQHL